MNVNKVSNQSIEAMEPNKSLVIDKSMWNSIISRSGGGILKNDKIQLENDLQYKNYLYEGSRAMADKLKKYSEPPTEVEKAESIKIKRFQFDELNEVFYESNKNRLLDNVANSKIEIATMESVVSGNKNLARRKQDEYKTELKQFIDRKRQEQIVLNEERCEQQRLEREGIDKDLKEQFKEEQRLLAERKAARRKIEIESRQITSQRKN